MDANRSLIVFAAAVLVVLVAFLGLVPALIQGVNPDAVGGSPLVYDEDAELFQTDAERFAEVEETAPVRRARLLGPSESFVPRTRAEHAWVRNWEKLEREEAEAARDREAFERWQGFMESSLGGNVQSAFELLRRGHAEEAGNLLSGMIPEILEQPADVKQPLLKAAVRLFFEAGDQQAMAEVLLAFLEGQEKLLEERTFDAAQRDQQETLLEEVRTYLAQARAKAAEVGS